MPRQPAPFTDEELKDKTERLIEKWAPRLGLLNWNFRVLVEDGGGDWAMCGGRPSYYQKVVIRVDNHAQNPELEFSDETFEGNVVHELAHFLVAPIRDLMANEFEEHGLIWDRYTNAEETVVDGLSHMLIRLAREDHGTLEDLIASLPRRSAERKTA